MPGEADQTYALVMKDDFSGYVWILPASADEAETVADALIRWIVAFSVVENWVSDRGTQVKNGMITLLRESKRFSHHFTFAYCPWSNGTVEVVFRELLPVMQALLSEFQLAQRCWPSLLPLVQSALNNSSLPGLGNRCPLTASTELKQNNPLTAIKRREGGIVTVQSL